MIKKRNMVFCLIPAVIITAVFYVIPLIYLACVSLYSWDGLGSMDFAGFKNFAKIFGDPVFLTAIKNTVLWVAAALIIHVPLGLLLALVLSKKPFGWKFLRVSYFLPNVISITATAFLWYFIYHIDMGLINNVLRAIGMGSLARSWLGSPSSASIAILVPFSLYVGLTMIIFLTQLSTISPDLYEAAEIDGANTLQKDVYISIPLLKDAVRINILLNVAFCLKNFEYPFLMTSGGPNNSTMNLSLYIYKEMINANRYGTSMAAGLITVIIGCAVLLTVQNVARERNEIKGQ